MAMKLHLFVAVVLVLISRRISDGRDLRVFSGKASAEHQEANAYSRESGSSENAKLVSDPNSFAEGGKYHPIVLKQLEMELHKMVKHVRSRRARICSIIPRPRCP